jgi:hypothetical protein
MMKLPIDQLELDQILKTVKHVHPNLYSKLWSYKINYLKNQEKS